MYRALMHLALFFSLACVAHADEFAVPQGLAPLKIPVLNPLTAAKVELGKQLYFDERLSRDNTVSCASCHHPDHGWSNGAAIATGIGGQKGGRSAPTVLNAAYFPLQFWDGRANDLEGQALGPIQNPIEMNLTLPEALTRLNSIPGYKQQFQAVFGTEATQENLAQAIAAFERTILSGNAPFDKYKAGNATALSPAAERGRQVFFNKANCSACHSGGNFSDAAFHNIGVGMNKPEPDLGRYEITKLEGDKGAFKTPGLRDIARTAPYMHDGSLQTLEEVVTWYNKGGFPNPQLDEELFPLQLTDQQQADLVIFLKEGLASEKYPDIKKPELPK